MQFYSTNRQCRMVSLEEAVMRGLAPDGGLFMPEHIPVIPKAFFNNISELNVREIAYVVANLMLGSDIDSEDIQKIVNETFTFDIPLVRIEDSIFSLELYHGPTLAFKDVGARFLARVISHFGRARKHERIKVLVATSGDSGGAVANGFLNVPGVEVYVLYSQGGLSSVQKAQFCIPNSNIHPIEVIGTFDDCQKLVKEAFADMSLRSHTSLTSANSINICRLIPQMFYFFYAYASLVLKEGYGHPVVMAVPCGNLGNLTAGLMAHKMGLPVNRFVVTNNDNDVTVEYLRKGIFNPKRAIRTVACAMDVGNPSNMSRILDMFDGSHDEIVRIMKGYAFSDTEIINAISETNACHNYLLDPHGATAYLGLKEDLQEGEKGIFLSTAHPSKFPRTVSLATGRRFTDLHSSSPARMTVPRISASFDALKKQLLQY